MEQGHAHFSMVVLVENRKGISDQLKANLYKNPVLIPAAPWLSATPPTPPVLNVDTDGVARTRTIDLRSFERSASGHAWHLAAWIRVGGTWQFVIGPAGMGLSERTDIISVRFPYSIADPTRAPDRVSAFSVDRFGNESPRVTWSADGKQ